MPSRGAASDAGPDAVTGAGTGAETGAETGSAASSLQGHPHPPWGADAQATSVAARLPRIHTRVQRPAAARRNPVMWLLILEALAALLLLIGLVWWTMFSGRRKGERAQDDPDRR